MDLQLDPKAKGAAKNSRDSRPTPDQIYLASRLSDIAPQGHLTMAALQKLNSRYGVVVVSDALRLLRGFPPEVDVRSPYAYIAALCEKSDG